MTIRYFRWPEEEEKEDEAGAGYDDHLGGIRGGPKEDRPAGGEQAEAVEELEDVAAGLVHGGDDRHAVAGGDARDVAHDVVGGGAVEAAGGLVKEEQARPREHLDADAEPVPLPAADALGDPAADARVHGVGEPHLPDHPLCVRPLLRQRHRVRQLQLRRVVHGLPHGQRRHQHVVLGHVCLCFTYSFIHSKSKLVSKSGLNEIYLY